LGPKKKKKYDTYYEGRFENCREGRSKRKDKAVLPGRELDGPLFGGRNNGSNRVYIEKKTKKGRRNSERRRGRKVSNTTERRTTSRELSFGGRREEKAAFARA